MSALWGSTDDGHFYAYCTECAWEESAGALRGADGVMVAASASARHNNTIHVWDDFTLEVPA